MTIPFSKSFPTRKTANEDQETDTYLVTMVNEVQDAYDELARGINGEFRSSYENQRKNWTPVLKGTTKAGTFIYNHQIGWVFRQGLIVDVWGDVNFSANGGATGSLYVELPYKVGLTDQKPFVGECQSSLITYVQVRQIFT
jgi:hypothetical protein